MIELTCFLSLSVVDPVHFYWQRSDITPCALLWIAFSGEGSVWFVYWSLALLLVLFAIISEMDCNRCL